MKNIQFIAAAGAAALFVSACATPRVVEAQQAGDRNLSCAEIMQQIDEARQFEEAARDDRSVNTTNVAAAVLFWPALVGTYMNTEEAIEAAQDRREHLNRLYENKGC